MLYEPNGWVLLQICWTEFIKLIDQKWRIACNFSPLYNGPWSAIRPSAQESNFWNLMFCTLLMQLFVFPVLLPCLFSPLEHWSYLKENWSQVLIYNPACQSLNINPLYDFLSEGAIHPLSDFFFNYLQQE